MPGDPTSRNDEELLSQIDELKARMDRLMRGGTSTSNSALLTDAVPPATVDAAPASPPGSPVPSRDRSRVRDLIGPSETEAVEVYPGSREAVSFAESDAHKPPAAQPPAAAASPSKPSGGSLVDGVDEGRGPRPRVASFDQLGSAVEEELSRDASVPPPEQRRGPDLASRFGPAEDSKPSQPAEAAPAADEIAGEADEPEGEAVQPGPVVEYPSSRRGGLRLIAAIWVLVALLGGAIATLHFTGII